jgi:hypothetical protein
MKEEHEDSAVSEQAGDIVPSVIDSALADQLAQELQCGCCSELVYRPVLVSPCQHFFCGRWALPTVYALSLANLLGMYISCCVLWIRVSDFMLLSS